MQTKRAPSLVRYAWLSVGVAVATMAIKGIAFGLTRSVGILSDALESVVNLTAALLAVRVLRESSKPPDKEHTFGHGKAEYFSSLFEGILIGIAAVSIIVTALNRLLKPEPIANIPLGLAFALGASLLNFFVAGLLLRVGRENRSIALEANGEHLMSDVWTSMGILVGLGAFAITNWQPLDSLIALAVAVKISRTSFQLIRRSVQGLMDSSLPESQIQAIGAILNRYREQGIDFHALRTRQAGAHSFVTVHVITPGDWSVKRGHDLLEAIEGEIHDAVPLCTIFTHLEPREDPRTWEDTEIDEGILDSAETKIKDPPGTESR